MKQVSAGIIICKNKILIARRNHHKSLSGLWEFPGGKQEEGETLQECLKREIMEELRLEISVGNFLMQSIYEYEHGAICLNAYYAYADSDEIIFHSRGGASPLPFCTLNSDLASHLWLASI